MKNLKLQKEKKKEPEYKGKQYHSWDEIHFIWYLEELLKEGFISRFKDQPEYILSEKLKINNIILREHHYTADFKFQWTNKAIGIFHTLLNEKLFNFIITDLPISVIDIKPSLSNFYAGNAKYKQSNVKNFKINQKWVYQVHKIYVQEIEIHELFGKTFTPNRYLFTNQNPNLKRKIDFKTRTLEEYVRLVKELSR
jgi:hypothetical protein